MSLHLIHPKTGLQLAPIGYRRNGSPIWPILGAAPDDAADAAAAAAAATAAADQAAADQAAADAAAAWDRPYPQGKAVADMTLEEKVSYHEYHSKKHEQRAKSAPSKEEWDAAQAKIKAFEDATLSDSEKAIAEAYEKGKSEASANGATLAVQALVDARKTYLDATKDADTIESLDLIDYTKFIKDGSVDSVRLTKVLDRLAPVGGGASDNQNGRWPATGQGNQHTGTGSAKDAGKAEAEKRFGKPADQ